MTSHAHATATGIAAGSMMLGFMDGGVVGPADAADTATVLQRAKQAGSSVWGLVIDWRSIAPTAPPSLAVASDPSWSGYRWQTFDAEVRAVAAAGLQAQVVVADAPAWAEGPGRPSTAIAPAGSWKPSAAWLGAFATALARRYSGAFPDPSAPGSSLPDIRYWEAWNEPNLTVYLAPQWQRTARGYQPISPGWYRGMLNAFYHAVKAVAPSDVVAGGTTAPFGDPTGGQRMPPAMFWRDLLCLTAGALPRPTHCGAHVYFDAVSHHPYPIGPPTFHAAVADDVTVPDLGKITRLIPFAERAGTLLPKTPKPLWITEISWNSDPPDPNGLSLADQAQYLEGAIDVLYHEGASMFIWFNLRDDPPPYGGDLAGGSNLLGLASGVYTRGASVAQDTPKPSLTAFEFPFTAYRTRGFANLWGMAPAAGPVAIQEERGASWVTVLTLNAATTRIFSGSLLIGPRTNLRAVSGSATSLTWTTF